MIVKLAWSEVLMASIWACFRVVQSNKLGCDNLGVDIEKNVWQYNVMGCIAETAFAKHRKTYYNASIGDYKAADVDDFYQIRSTPMSYKSNACLTLHKWDNPDQPYILALVGIDRVEFVGWLYGADGQQEKYWCDRWNQNRPAYFIPQTDLKPMAILPEKGYAEGATYGEKQAPAQSHWPDDRGV